MKKKIPNLKGRYFWILDGHYNYLTKGAKKRKITRSAFLREILGSLTA